MKKLAIVTLSVVFVAALMLCFSAGAADEAAAKAKPAAKAPAAKATEKAKESKKASSDKEAIDKLLAEWTKYGEAKDLPKLLTLYSDKFSNYEYGDKKGLEKFIQDAIDMGYLDNAKVDMTKVKTKIEDKKATVTGLEMKAAFGQANIDLTLAKEDKGWKIVGQDVQQY